MQWTDKEYQCQSLLPVLRQQLPLLTLGDNTPAFVLVPPTTCMIARTLDDKLPEEAILILYLPGVCRQEMRAVEDCPSPCSSWSRNNSGVSA